MTEPFDFEAWFRDNYGFIQRLTAATARVLGIRGDEAEDFASWAAMRLWDNNYAQLRKWRGLSSIETYVRIVVTNLGREYRDLLWGRWRSSAAALRLGRLAILLEQTVYRDGLRPHEAFELLRTRGEAGSRSDTELAALLARLPVRPRSRRREGPGVEIEDVADDAAAADDVVVVDERDRRFREVLRVLRNALEALTPEQRLLIELHYLKAMKISDVARTLHIEQKPLYRERDRALATIARRLGDAGIDWEEVRELLGGDQPPPDDPEYRGEADTPDDPNASGNLDGRDNTSSRPSNKA